MPTCDILLRHFEKYCYRCADMQFHGVISYVVVASRHLLSFHLRFSPLLYLRGKISLRLLELARKWQFPHVYYYCTVVSPYHIAALCALCTITASFSTLCVFCVYCIASSRPSASPVLDCHELQTFSMVIPHLLLLSLRYFVTSLVCVILCVSIPCNMPPWLEQFTLGLECSPLWLGHVTLWLVLFTLWLEWSDLLLVLYTLWHWKFSMW